MKRNLSLSGQVPQCKNYGLNGHSIEKYCKLIVYPKDYKSRSKSNNQNKSFSDNSTTGYDSESFVSGDNDNVSNFCYLLMRNILSFLKSLVTIRKDWMKHLSVSIRYFMEFLSQFKFSYC